MSSLNFTKIECVTFPTISQRQLAVLRVLWSYGPEQAVFMKTIATLTDLEKKAVRRAVRVLARKGLAELNHVWNEDDWCLAGSGYSITTKGCKFMHGADPPEIRVAQNHPDPMG